MEINQLTKPYFKDSHQKPVKDDYIIHDMLGDGGFSVVKRGIRNTDQMEVAIKMIKKRKVNQEDVEREVSIWRLASANSEKVVKLYDIYEDSQHVNLIMELMKGGELFEKIVEMDDYSELYAAKVMKQLFYIIKDLHKIDIVHQDLKPENLLLTSKDSMTIKLCDFGLAEIADDNIELVGIVGSTTYMAPEVVSESGHGKPVDVYAAGVIMYILLCGYPPFEPENGITELEFPEPEWDEITETAKELITQLLNSDPNKRPSPDAVLKHKWFMDIETVREDKAKLLNNTVRTLRMFKDITPHGTMKEFRGKEKASLFGLFPEAKENIGTGAPAGQTAKPKTQSKHNLDAPEKTNETPSNEKPANANENKQNDNAHSPTEAKNDSKKDERVNLENKTQSNSSKDLKNKTDGKKSKSERDKRASVAVTFGSVNTSQKETSGKLNQAPPSSSKKSKHNKNHRASTSVASLLQKDGLVDFDPIGKFSKKSEKEQLKMALNSVVSGNIGKNVDTVLSNTSKSEKKDKKKENRRSARYDKPMFINDFDPVAAKKAKHSSAKNNSKQKGTQAKTTPRMTTEQEILDALLSFQTELQYQKQLADFLKQEVESLRTKLSEEQGKSEQLEKKLQSELDNLKKEAEQERKRRRKMEETLNGSQKSHNNQVKTPHETPVTNKKADVKKNKAI